MPSAEAVLDASPAHSERLKVWIPMLWRVGRETNSGLCNQTASDHILVALLPSFVAVGRLLLRDSVSPSLNRDYN